MEQGKRKEDEQQLHAVRFAAGVAVLMACLERAALVSFFEQWRVWVFLALNLLLLAILFTSTYTTCSSSSSTPPNEFSSSSTHEENNTTDVELKSDGKKWILKQCSNLEPTKRTEDNSKILKSESIREEIIRNCSVEGEEKEEDEEDAERKSRGLSKEELNERVEAFIAMFRQQYLVSDHSTVTSRRRRKTHRAPVMGGGCRFVPSHIRV